MTFEEVDSTLSSGFHDAYLQSFEVNFATREAHLELRVLVEQEDLTERYEGRRLSFSGLSMFQLEEPEHVYTHLCGKELEIDRVELCDQDRAQLAASGTHIPPANFWAAFFVYAWNSRIIINASSAMLTNSGNDQQKDAT